MTSGNVPNVKEAGLPDMEAPGSLADPGSELEALAAAVAARPQDPLVRCTRTCTCTRTIAARVPLF